jgi:hypothetical protein
VATKTDEKKDDEAKAAPAEKKDAKGVDPKGPAFQDAGKLHEGPAHDAPRVGDKDATYRTDPDHSATAPPEEVPHAALEDTEDLDALAVMLKDDRRMMPVVDPVELQGTIEKTVILGGGANADGKETISGRADAEKLCKRNADEEGVRVVTYQVGRDPSGTWICKLHVRN